MIYPITINSAPTHEIDHEDEKRLLTTFFGRYNVDPGYFLSNQPYGNKVVRDELSYKKRQLKNKWTDLFQQSHPPYTIAFPALIRTRRWID